MESTPLGSSICWTHGTEVGRHERAMARLDVENRLCPTPLRPDGVAGYLAVLHSGLGAEFAWREHPGFARDRRVRDSTRLDTTRHDATRPVYDSHTPQVCARHVRNRVCKVRQVPHLRIAEAASLLGVSDDTVRRWAEQGRLRLQKGENGRSVVDGVQLASLARELAEQPAAGGLGPRSARNSLRGIVTRVTRDTVMAQVELQAGPFRVVSLMSREAADELDLEVGTVAYASIKATNVVVELDDRPRP